jgi:hypothetical protein
MKLKTFHGSSPEPVERTAQTKNSSNLELQPTSLFHEYESVESNLKNISSNPIYKSPLQLMIDELDENINVKTVELESAKDHLNFLERKYSNPTIKNDKSKAQCGQCHLRIGHTKRHCDLGKCEGPEMCNDLDKHDKEKKQIGDAAQSVKNLSRELEKLKQTLLNKKQTYKETCDTFFSKVLPFLVNTNIDKYYPVGMYGLRSLAMGAIHPDMAVLEKHFQGIAPNDLQSAAKSFPTILKSVSRQMETKRVDPVRKLIEQNGVRFPNFSTNTTHTATAAASSSIQAPTLPLPFVPYPQQFIPFPVTFPWNTNSPGCTPFPGNNQCTSNSSDADREHITSPLPPKKRKQ